MTRLGSLDHAPDEGWSPPDRRLADLATRQHGVVGRRQLFDLGLGRSAIARRVEGGRLHPVHAGVYAVGHRSMTTHARWMAAVLAYGSDALLSHHSAAALWGIAEVHGDRVHVSAPRSRHGRVGIALHRPRSVHTDDRSMQDGVPVTSVARTLLDLAGTTGRRRLARAVDEADRLELLDLEAVASLCDRSRGRRGPASLRRVLADHSPPALTRSELERRFLDVCASAALPTPATNVRVGGFEVDALWRERGLVVELDGYEYHRTRAAFERDRARDVALRLAGYAVVRFTYRQITNQPGVVTTALRALLTDETGPAGLFRSRIR